MLGDHCEQSAHARFAAILLLEGCTEHLTAVHARSLAGYVVGSCSSLSLAGSFDDNDIWLVMDIKLLRRTCESMESAHLHRSGSGGGYWYLLEFVEASSLDTKSGTSFAISLFDSLVAFSGINLWFPFTSEQTVER